MTAKFKTKAFDNETIIIHKNSTTVIVGENILDFQEDSFYYEGRWYDVIWPDSVPGNAMLFRGDELISVYFVK